MPNGSKHFFITDNSKILDGPGWQLFAREYCECFTGQEELGGKTGNLHFQIYFKTKERHTFDWVKKTRGINELHLEACKSAAGSWDYCSKPESRVDGGWSFTLGERPTGQGARNDLSDLKRALDSGGLGGAFEECFSSAVKYTRGCQTYLGTKLGQHRRDHKTTCWVFTGAAGCGKSSLASALARHFGVELYVKPCSEKWFDHYDPLIHKAVLLDDFTGWIPYNQLLAICDRGQAFVEIKGQVVPFLAEHIFITSNVPWKDWYVWEKKSPDAFKRRIDFEWLGDFEPTIVPINGGAAIDLEAEGQRPKCPVILGGPLDFTPLYLGDGQWDIDEIVINED